MHMRFSLHLLCYVYFVFSTLVFYIDSLICCFFFFFFFQAEDGIRDVAVTGVQTCALPICEEKPLRDTRGRLARPAGWRRRDIRGRTARTAAEEGSNQRGGDRGSRGRDEAASVRGMLQANAHLATWFGEQVVSTGGCRSVRRAAKLRRCSCGRGGRVAEGGGLLNRYRG